MRRMMKRRERRRFLTKKYQDKQIQYIRDLWGPEFDDARKLQSERARKHFFTEFLRGNVVLLNDKYLNYWHWGIPSSGMRLSKELVGRLKKHSFDDCGNPDCIGCANPRKIWKGSLKKEQSLEEHKANEQMRSDMEEFIENSSIDYVCRVNGHNPRK